VVAQQQTTREGPTYRALADAWDVWDNSLVGGPRLIASGAGLTEQVHDPEAWQRLQEAVR
jgi:hypothetical protein